MSVKKFRIMLVRYLDADLDKAERLEVEAHLKRCKECRKELECLKSSLALSRIHAPARFSRIEWNPPRVRHFSLWRWALVPLAAAAATLLVLIFGGDAGNRSSIPGNERDWVVVASDTLTPSEGSELAMLLMNEDSTFRNDLIEYESRTQRNIYSDLGELEKDEEEQLISLLAEQSKNMEGSL